MTSQSRRTLRKWLVAARMPLILLILIITATVLTKGQFTKVENLVNVVRQNALFAIIGFGMTLIITTGGIDLSVGSLVALAGVVGALIMEKTLGLGPVSSIALGAIAALLTGAAAGAVNGAIIAFASIPPFLVTLSAMLVTRGVAHLLCDSKPVYNIPGQILFLGRGYVFPQWIGDVLPVSVVVCLLCYLLMLVLLNRTSFGRRVIALGSNEPAAYLAGIPVRTTKMMVYLIGGAMAGTASFLHVGRMTCGDPKEGDMWELNVIAAVVVGGTSLFGGRGTMTGTLLGALIIGVLNNTLNLLNVGYFWQLVTSGLVILSASLFDVALKRLED